MQKTISLGTYMRLCGLPTSAQHRELDALVNKTGGYDFYWSLKQEISAVALGEKKYDQAIETFNSLVKDSEKKYNSDAFECVFSRFLSKKQLKFLTPPVSIFSTKDALLQVKVQPEFAYIEKGTSKAVHLWAMQSGSISQDIAGSALHIMQKSIPEDFECFIFDCSKKELKSSKIISNKPDYLLMSDFEKLDRLLKEIVGK